MKVRTAEEWGLTWCKSCAAPKPCADQATCAGVCGAIHLAKRILRAERKAHKGKGGGK